MIDRLAAAARGATEAYAAGDGLWMLEGGVRSDEFFRDIARAVLTAAKYEDGTDESRLIAVSNQFRVEAVSLSEAWDGLIDTILAESTDG